MRKTNQVAQNELYDDIAPHNQLYDHKLSNSKHVTEFNSYNLINYIVIEKHGRLKPIGKLVKSIV